MPDDDAQAVVSSAVPAATPTTRPTGVNVGTNSCESGASFERTLSDEDGSLLPGTTHRRNSSRSAQKDPATTTEPQRTTRWRDNSRHHRTRLVHCPHNYRKTLPTKAVSLETIVSPHHERILPSHQQQQRPDDKHAQPADRPSHPSPFGVSHRALELLEFLTAPNRHRMHDHPPRPKLRQHPPIRPYPLRRPQTGSCTDYLLASEPRLHPCRQQATSQIAAAHPNRFGYCRAS